MAKKYDHINFVPPLGVRKAAERGLALRKKTGKGGLSAKQAAASNRKGTSKNLGSGVQRAVNLKNGNKLSPATVKRMKAFFDRHSAFVYKHKEEPEGPARVSWLLWGGDPGYRWAKKVVTQMEKADKKTKK